jgi:hypothetical protein
MKGKRTSKERRELVLTIPKAPLKVIDFVDQVQELIKSVGTLVVGHRRLPMSKRLSTSDS